jgi:hypothetical protein
VSYSTVQYSTVQYSTVQYSTVQYSTVQYGTVRYKVIKTVDLTTFLPLSTCLFFLVIFLIKEVKKYYDWSNLRGRKPLMLMGSEKLLLTVFTIVLYLANRFLFYSGF